MVRAYVFGSYERGEADASSDLDLLVESDYSQPMGLQFIGMKYDLGDQLRKSVDLVSANAVSPVFVLLSTRISNSFMKGRFGNKQRIKHALDAVTEVENYEPCEFPHCCPQ